MEGQADLQPPAPSHGGPTERCPGSLDFQRSLPGNVTFFFFFFNFKVPRKDSNGNVSEF